MALVSLRQLLDHAAENGYGLPAFNVNNLEQIQAIMQAADECNSPVIMQGSAGARKYAGEAFLRHLIEAAVESYPHIPIVMHQDHGASPSVCVNAIRSGFSSVMMDGSLQADAKTPSTYEYNVNVTADVVNIAHSVGVSVEGELGCLGSLESGMGEAEDGHGAEGVLSHDQLLTDPEEAADFVRKTGVDALAIAIGTSHGAYKFTRKPTGDILAIQRIKEIHQRIPNTHLVMHGSSSVPQEWLDIIRQYGCSRTHNDIHQFLCAFGSNIKNHVVITYITCVFQYCRLVGIKLLTHHHVDSDGNRCIPLSHFIHQYFGRWNQIIFAQ